MAINSEFASLFKKYRLRSEIETLREFGDLMADIGIVYDNTIFTRWQKGERVPRDRKTILKVLEIFVKRGGISGLYECNKLLESVNLRDLTTNEASRILQNTHKGGYQIDVNDTDLFVSRGSLAKDACWELICNKKVLLYGHSGVGKTTLATYLLKMLVKRFLDGCYWFQVNTKSPEMVIDEILVAFNKKPITYSSVNEKISVINTLLIDSNLMIILDNLVSSTEDISLLFKLNGPVLITSTHYFAMKDLKSINVSKFTSEEYYQLAVKVLGKEYIDSHKDQLITIGKELGYLPMTSVLLMKQLAKNPSNVNYYLNQFVHSNIKESKPEPRTIDSHDSFNVILGNINELDRDILCAASVFMDNDFSIDSLSAITKLEKSLVSKIINNAYMTSFIHRLKNKRYKMHPLLREILQSKLTPHNYTIDLLSYYESKLSKLKHNEIRYEQFICDELDCIDNLRRFFYNSGEYKYSIRCWNLIRNHLFTSGKWSHLLSIYKEVEKSYINAKLYADLAYFYIEDLGKIYYFQSTDNNKALLYAKKGLQIAKRVRRKDIISLAEQKLGILAIESFELHKAKYLLTNAAKHFEKIHSYYQLMFTYIYLGHVYDKLNNYKKAIECFSYVANNRMSPKEVCAVAHTCIAALLANAGQINAAKESVNRSLKLGKELNLKLANGLAHACLAQIYFKEGKNANASLQILEANKLLSQLNFKPRPTSIWSNIIKINQ